MLLPQDVIAKVYKHHKIDRTRENTDPKGRPFLLARGTPIDELA